ncbi:cation-transporting P-type ATPase [Desulfuromonas versatilis]|uniref:Cation-transporting P-type ATPase n=1 Tax=Desulfuromonas versatilis TaxID=2802975 RepID=A0ABN6DTY7_9BACT|nr:cation-transporting P-type ATPase [Desulfuromonas versatilis]BCR03583.1 cation-transporting P-type ATPase [Desulfuromonas versatilis]
MNRQPPIPEAGSAWHEWATEKTFSHLESSPGGLTQAEAERRLARYGPNRLRPPKQRSAWVRFLVQFHNVLIYVLLFAALVTAALGHWVDSWVIFGVVLANALIGYIQEGKAERAMEAIRTMLSQQATVLRDGHRQQIQAENLVPGDVVFLQSGDKVPADLRLFKVKELRIEEAALTGESVPVEKRTEPVTAAAPLGDRSCLGFSGTLVTYGQGSGVVVATGDTTEIGQISALLSRVQPLTTRLLQQIAEFGRWLTAAIGAVALLTFAFGMLARDYSFGDMFLACVGLAVAAIPEGLPAIITITLALGVQIMARRSAIVRRLPAVETLGSVTVICSDKTGTLTRNEMTVQEVAVAEYLVKVGGVGYAPRGGFVCQGSELAPEQLPGLVELARAGLLCNDAALELRQGQWQLAGDPTEGALLTLAMKTGFDPAREAELFPRTDVIPFESEHRFMATLHHDHTGHGFIYVKGAPERVLEMCHRQRRAGEDVPIDLPFWQRRIDELAGRGQRLIAFAFKPAGPDQRELRFSDVEGGLTLLGLTGLIDPPRAEAIDAVKSCQSAGIRVKMITGDHALTARAIAAQMGIGDGRSVVNGRELEGMSDEKLRRVTQQVDVFARVSPEHKLRLVQALQADGQVVAMTGDGVNDAPALKRAEVGVAMGVKGTEVAKEAAEIVLADDNFATIAQAVKLGRTVYDNIRKAIIFILPTNGGEAGVIIAAILSGRMLPITPVQILWVNMITAVTLALSLAFEPPEEDVMARPPRDPKEPILSPFLIWRTLFVSLVLVIGTFGLFLWERLHEVSIETSRTVAVNGLVMFEIFYLLNSRYLKASVLNRQGLFGSRYVLGAIGLVLVFQLLFTYAPPLQHLFATAAIGFGDWVRIVLVGSSVLFVVEAEKWLLRWFERRQHRIPP